MIHNLTLENLIHFDGGTAAVAFGRMLQRSIQDCKDRPTEERTRKVTLQVELTPLETDGVLDDVEIVVQCKEVIPTFQTQTVRAQVRRQGKQLALVFGETEEETKVANDSDDEEAA